MRKLIPFFYFFLDIFVKKIYNYVSCCNSFLYRVMAPLFFKTYGDFMSTQSSSSKNKGHMDIVVDVPEEFQTKCKICEQTFKSSNALAGHVGAKHRVKFEDYLVKYFLDNVRPVCPICSEKTRYVRGKYSFKKYCKSHANEARKEWSKNNMAFDPGWKKGLTKEDHPGIMSQSKKMMREKNPWFGKSHPREVIERISKARAKALTLTKEEYDKRRKDFLLFGYEIIDEYSDDFSVKKHLNIRCPDNHLFKKPLNQFQIYKCCPHCNKSGQQEELENFIKSLNVDYISNNRNIISPKELDIFIPSHEFAIEYNGLYWHSELYKESSYHLNKTNQCKKMNIDLFHVFEDEWLEKKEIIKSMIRHRLNLTPHKIYARKCLIKKIEHAEKKDFFNNNHISGDIASKICFGLIYNDELICCLSLRNPLQNKYVGNIEIARFASKINTSVVGGLGKLLKRVISWSKQNGYNKILTYADKRFALQNSYSSVGFKYIVDTKVDYWYTDNVSRYNRFKFRAKDGISEKEVADLNGVNKIFGCGSKIYQMDI